MISCVSGTVKGRFPLLQRMIASVRSSVGNVPYEIIIVACDVENDTLKWLREQPDIVLEVLDEAPGAVKSFNLGFNRAKYKYVVTLNDDITVEGDTISRAYAYMVAHPKVGQVAFGHKYQNRKGNAQQPRVQRAYGYFYGQCCMTRTWIGKVAGWWGDYGLVQYGGDNHLSASVWNLGYEVHPVSGCSVVDWEYVDDSRRRFSDQMRDSRGVHPDAKLLHKVWKGRLPKPSNWMPARFNQVLVKAAQGNLRTLRFKAMMGSGLQYKPRMALVNELAQYGPTQQANQSEAITRLGRNRAQDWFVEVANRFQPDLILLQSQRDHNIFPGTVPKLRGASPGVYIVNWDADTHYPMLPFHAEIARQCDLQLTISPDLFPWYMKHGVYQIGYWPISVEQEFIDIHRHEHFQESGGWDVLFLGSLYGEGQFPEADTRRESVLALHRAKDINLGLFGLGWNKVGLNTRKSLEDFVGNPLRYCKAKMALSVSQTKDLWGYTSDRCYNILATGCPILIQKFNGMEEHGLVDGVNCIAWTTLPEMLAKARYYKEHPGQREDLGRAGKKLLLTRHTWKHRIHGLFQLIAELGE